MVSPRINVDNMEVKVDRRPCTELPLSLSGVSGSSPFIVPYFLTRDLPNKIDDGLYLGSLKSATDRDELKSLGITHILTVAGGLGSCPFPETFTYSVVEVDDRMSADLAAHFSRCFAFIDEGLKSGGVLVHCLAGMSRSVTIVTAYLMKTKGWNLRRALGHVKAKRPIAQPNLGFLRQLEDFETALEWADGGQGYTCGSSTTSLDSWFS